MEFKKYFFALSILTGVCLSGHATVYIENYANSDMWGVGYLYCKDGLQGLNCETPGHMSPQIKANSYYQIPDAPGYDFVYIASATTVDGWLYNAPQYSSAECNVVLLHSVPMMADLSKSMVDKVLKCQLGVGSSH